MATYAFAQNKFIFIFSGLMLAAGAVYFGYRILNEAFLSETEAVGKVVGKEHVPYSMQKRMQNIGGTNRMVDIAIPETWLLEVDLGGTRAKAAVDNGVFNATEAGTPVKVRYRQQRISRNLQVTAYLGTAGE